MAKARSMTRLRPGGRSRRLGGLVSPLGAGILAAVAAVAAVVTASAASSAPLAGRAQAPAPPHCQTAQCAAAAKTARAKDFPPASTTIPPASRWATESAVAAAARGEAESPAGGALAPARAAALPVAVRRMTIHQFDVSQGLADDAGILPGRSVWVVTVHGHMAEDVPPGHRPIIASVYTDVFDEATGTLIMTAIGLDMSRPRS
jgi:hypothetical protein